MISRLMSIAVVFALPLAAQSAPRARAMKTAADSMSTPAGIIARHYAAMGGKRAFDAIKQQHIVQEMTMSQGGVEMLEGRSKVESFMIRPNKMLMRMTVGAFGTTETGFNGEIGWTNSPLTGPTLIDETQVEALKRSTANTSQIMEATDSMRVVARKDIAGRPAIGLLVKAEGVEFTQYYDVGSGLLVAMQMARDSGAVVAPGMMIFGDYKKVGAILVSMKMTMEIPGGEMVMRTTHVDFGPIDRAVFNPPPEVRALLAKKSP